VARRPVGRVVDAPALHAHARVAAAGLPGLVDGDRDDDGGVRVCDGGGSSSVGGEEGLFDGRGLVLAGSGVF
jgi:predicted amino acid dehydrogenase